MARRNIEVVITVRDAASKPLGEAERKMKGLGKATTDANMDLTKFNRTLFTTTAFVGTFIKAFSALRGSLDAGADLDRLSNQFERVLGPKGKLFDAIDLITTTSVDKFEAMRSGLSLANLGIVQNTDQVADIVAKAGTAAKMAGLDAGEGIKQYTEFLKDGSVSHLEFFNLVARTNPALQAQMAILHKSGGVMGTVISTQQKLSMGTALLNAATMGHLKGARDLADTMLDLGQNFKMLRSEIGRLLGSALGPIIDRISHFLYQMSKTIDNVRKNEKQIVFLTRAMVLATGAVLGLAGAFGTLSLVTKLLGFAGIGLPGLNKALTILSIVFLGLTNSADSFSDRLRIIGSFIQGVYQLITSLDPSTGFAKMDKAVYDILKKNGLLILVQNIARLGSVIKTVITDGINAFTTFGNAMDRIFGGAFRKIISMFDAFKQPWNMFWVSDAITPMQKFARSAAVILGSVLGLLAGKKLINIGFGLLSKIPGVGKMFGGGRGSGPSGSAGDPLYVVDAGGAVAKALGGVASGMGGMTTLLRGALGVAAAGAAGYAAGSGLDALATSYAGKTNKYGQTYNPYEKGIAKMLPQWAGGMSSDQFSDTYGSNSGSQYTSDMEAPKSTVSIPKMPDSQLDVIDSLGEELKSVEGAKRKSLQSAIEGSLSTSSQGGSQITPNEYTAAMLEALDKSENLSTLAGKAKASNNIIDPSSRRQQPMMGR